jgi:large subunit ribosomal protein L17
MRHQKKTVKLGRTAEHRKALLANQVCSLIEHSRIKTTLAKAKAVRPFAEKMITLGKKGSLHNRRTAIAYLHHPDKVKKLFEEIAPRSASRAGGYTRIVKLGPRPSDSAPMAFIEWVDNAPAVEGDDLAPKTATVAKPESKPAKSEADAGSTEESKKKRGSVGSKRAAEIAKRAGAKYRKETATKTQQIKPKAGMRNKGGRSSKKR